MDAYAYVITRVYACLLEKYLITHCILMKLSESNHWMNIYNEPTLNVNLSQDGRYSQLTLANTKLMTLS